jgi:protein-S-isoprenylcysteine O-methyltransferase Ste14
MKYMGPWLFWDVLLGNSWYSRRSICRGKGPYGFIRHPSYTGALVIFIGLGLAIQSWGAVLSLILLFSLAYGYRMHIEEKALISELGEEYIEYKKGLKDSFHILYEENLSKTG